ncbi:hypothetical protein PoB_006530700 [Plakobranchus ocellatus]|uniref:HTH psq-type domain-containing protein n=1 Tax=Plakobranchus ocellatus TaxID=259542 RepID=A0AAV4D3P4_9GAST|nr:hypothetical protein PoB_006530700 [Plakobranchus ocellatus]
MNAAKQFGVPRATLFDKLHNRIPMKPSVTMVLTTNLLSFLKRHEDLRERKTMLLRDAPKSQLIVATASEKTSKSNGPGPSGDGVFPDKMDAIATSQYIEEDLEPTIHDDVVFMDAGQISNVRTSASLDMASGPELDIFNIESWDQTYEDAPATSLDHTYNRTKHTATESFQSNETAATKIYLGATI